MNEQRIQVECYSGYKADERPMAFTYQGTRHEISEIADRWYEGGLDSGRPVVNYFKVKTTDGRTYRIGYRPESDSWFLCL